MQYTALTATPVPTGITNGALALFLKSYQDALLKCNADKTAIADWADSLTK